MLTKEEHGAQKRDYDPKKKAIDSNDKCHKHRQTVFVYIRAKVGTHFKNPAHFFVVSLIIYPQTISNIYLFFKIKELSPKGKQKNKK